MKPRYLILLAFLSACSDRNPENSSVCGFSAMAGANMVQQQLMVPGKILTDLPAGVEGIVPARVVGYGTSHAIAAMADDGVVLGYQGEGFPATPGYGLVLVEDSLDTFQGVLVFDLEPLQGIPQLGTISSSTMTIPLYGLRVMWSSVSSERCPMFVPPDTGTTAETEG